MKKIILFTLRFFLYLSVLGLLYFHPGISVSFDREGIILYFVIIPLEMVIGFLPAPRANRYYKFLLAVLPLIPLSLYLGGGFGLTTVAIFWIGLLSFAGTLLLFHHPRWGTVMVLEPFFLAWMCFNLLVFSRSSETVAAESMGITQFIMIWTGLAFLLNSAVVYFCRYPQGISGVKREAALLGLGSAAVLGLFFILPADFVRNAVVANLISDRVEEKIKPDDNEWGIPKDGGGRRRQPGRGTIPGDEQGRQPELRGISEYDWPGEEGGRGRGKGKSTGGRNSGEDGGEDRQYTVMVVASKQEPVYMGNSFRGSLDPVEGFLPTPDEFLNRLPSMRLFVTWFDNNPVFGRDRQREEVFSLSTLSRNFLPYRPVEVEPTVLSENSGPLRYIHRVISDMYPEDPLKLAFSRIRELRSKEKTDLALYLEVPLADADKAVFWDYLSSALNQWQDRAQGSERIANANQYIGKILAILTSFGDYQYNVSDNDDFSIARLIDFLLNTKDGDCVEFSNSVALLGRLAGIPSRVVTGYLAADSLQTMAHLRGLAALRSKIKVLQDFPFEDLYLVTDAHSHSWVQFYVPDYGWLDFEATAFAIPPIGFGDGNLRDVVIPLIDETRVVSPVRAFPWKAVLRSLGMLAGATLLGAYALRYGREILLRLGARRGGRAGAYSLYLLLLARLAAEGKPIKPASKTATEYAQLFPDLGGQAPFGSFAALYSELRWREFKNVTERDERFLGLKQEYSNIISAAKRRGIRGFLVRIFSLRGLAYL